LAVSSYNPAAVNGLEGRIAAKYVAPERIFSWRNTLAVERTTDDPAPEQVDALARELWEAHSLHHEQLTRLPAEPWEALDGWMQNHWRMLARTALAFAAAVAP
jgi:hypothetical protein